MNEFARPNLAVDQLPPANSADKDKVLTIDANGVPVWAENSGGGAGGGVLVVHADMQTMALDKTWQEIHDAGFSALIMPIGENTLEIYVVSSISIPEENEYDVAYSNGHDQFGFTASSASGYPIFNQ